MRCFCTPRFSSSLQKRTFRQQGRLSRFRDASFLIPWGWAKTRAYGVYDDAVCASRAYGVWLWCGSMGVRVPRVRMGVLWCVAVWRRCHFFTEKHLVWGTFFHMQRYEKLSNYASFSASFSRLFYCFFLTFPNLFSRCFSSPFPICSYVSPLLQKWPLSPSVTPLREMSQALPPNAPAQLSLSRTGDRSLIFQSPSLDTPDFTAAGAIGLPFAAFC